MEDKRNSVLFDGKDVIKQFANRADYVRETGVYAKLRHTGLVPELKEKQDGTIVLEYINGETLFEALERVNGNKAELAKLFELFFGWYKAYREKTSLILGDVSLKNFIISDKKLYGVDFESCHPGYMEQDMARLTAIQCILPTAFSADRLDRVKLFLCVGAAFLDWNPTLLAEFIPDELMAVCRENGIEYDAATARYIATAATTAGIVLAGGMSTRMKVDKKTVSIGGKPMISASTALLTTQPQRFISVASSDSGYSHKGFVTVVDEKPEMGPIGGMVSTLNKCVQPWALFLTCDMPFLAEPLIKAMLMAAEEDTDAIMFKTVDGIQTFPLLLRVSTGRPLMQDSLDKKQLSVGGIIKSKLRVKLLNPSDVDAYVEGMLRNVNTTEDLATASKK